MQIIAAAPVGARGLRGVSVAVVEPRPSPNVPLATETAALAAQGRLEAETVVFPRRRSQIDTRSDYLRRQRAAARYRQHERPVEPSDRRGYRL